MMRKIPRTSIHQRYCGVAVSNVSRQTHHSGIEVSFWDLLLRRTELSDAVRSALDVGHNIRHYLMICLPKGVRVVVGRGFKLLAMVCRTSTKSVLGFFVHSVEMATASSLWVYKVTPRVHGHVAKLNFHLSKEDRIRDYFPNLSS